MTDGEAREMARELVRGSIIEDAASQFIAQILKHAHDERVKPLRKQVAALEAKLAGGVLAEYDDGSTVFLSGYAGGAAIGGAWSTLTLMEKAPDGTLREREYKAQGDWRATLAEIKAT